MAQADFRAGEDAAAGVEWPSLRMARASSLRTHSRVRPTRSPTSCSVKGASPSRPNRRTTTARSRSSSSASRRLRT